MKLVILDRDGVINRDSVDFIKTPGEWHPIPGSLSAIGDLTRSGYQVAVATNQSGVGRGLLDTATLQAINDRMKEEIAAVGGRIDALVFCPHLPDDNCDCRKPRSGLFEQLAETFNLSLPLSNVPCIGDSRRDIEAARVAGGRPILVRTGNGFRTERELGSDGALEIYDDLSDAVRVLLDEDAS
jgi:D-glycero-D-manno-heptose 1,7-bisphosphate phosphatase